MEAMLLQVAEREFAVLSLVRNEERERKIRFFRVRPGTHPYYCTDSERQAASQLNVLFSSCIAEFTSVLHASSVGRSSLSESASSLLCKDSEKPRRNGSLFTFSEACPIFCKDKRFIRFRTLRPRKTVIFGKKLRVICVRNDRPALRITGVESVIRVISPVICFSFSCGTSYFCKKRGEENSSPVVRKIGMFENPLRDENKQLNLIGMKTNLIKRHVRSDANVVRC